MPQVHEEEKYADGLNEVFVTVYGKRGHFAVIK